MPKQPQNLWARKGKNDRRIEDYALIGDCETAALVGRDGSVDWLCWPRFDSGACLAALLGGPEHGRWQIAPCADVIRTSRRYRNHSLILETEFETADGVVMLVDFMPPRGDASDLVRMIVGKSGRVALRAELIVRFDYGALVPWVTRLDDGRLRAVAGPDMVLLQSSVPIHGEKLTTISEFTVAAGETASFVLTYGPSNRQPPDAVVPHHALDETETFWSEWTDRCTYQGKWRDAVLRSLVTLKALTYRPSGGIVAAPTTSLPEKIGGRRNWDYRYCWLRDATFTLLSLMNVGYRNEARAWHQWLLRAIAGAASQMHIMYGVMGERRLQEWEVDWLPGFCESRPVRVGNAAYRQRQIDVFGEVMDALHQARCTGLALSDEGWQIERLLVAYLNDIWDQPDEGIWEVRCEPREFTHSRVMAWVAVDRAIKSAERFNLPAPLAEWSALRDRIHADVCRRGYNEFKGTFVQSYGSDALDASLLLLPIVGFLPPTDPRIRGTVAAIERELMVDGLVQRYDTSKSVDGLPPGEGAFLACSFWLVDNYVLQGRHDEAERLFEHLLSLRNDLGLLAEEYDPVAKRQLGNFPQAFSHLALIDSASNLAASMRHPAKQRVSEEAPADVD
jgi:GH15 family glucan-1,4-alpha-glucosidase